MNKFILITCMAFCANAAHAEYVNGYTRSNGTYVAPHERSAPDSTVQNNYSYQNNFNPSSGQTGTDHYQHDTTSQYYNNTPDSNGNTGHSSNRYQNTYR